MNIDKKGMNTILNIFEKNKQTNKQTNEGTNKRMNERKNKVTMSLLELLIAAKQLGFIFEKNKIRWRSDEQTNKRMNEQTNKGTKSLIELLIATKKIWLPSPTMPILYPIQYLYSNSTKPT